MNCLLNNIHMPIVFKNAPTGVGCNTGNKSHPFHISRLDMCYTKYFILDFKGPPCRKANMGEIWFLKLVLISKHRAAFLINSRVFGILDGMKSKWCHQHKLATLLSRMFYFCTVVGSGDHYPISCHLNLISFYHYSFPVIIQVYSVLVHCM